MNRWLIQAGLPLIGLCLAMPAQAQTELVTPELMGHWAAVASLFVFGVAYALVIFEETTHLRKSKPVMVAAGVIWMLVALTYAGSGETELYILNPDSGAKPGMRVS